MLMATAMLGEDDKYEEETTALCSYQIRAVLEANSLYHDDRRMKGTTVGKGK